MQDKEFDFKKTLFLPDTSFPMRASLPTREPGWLEHWNRLKIYYKLREKSANRKTFMVQTSRGFVTKLTLCCVVLKYRHIYLYTLLVYALY